MWNRLAPAVIVSLIAAGCTISHVDAAATVHISGRAVDASGSPLAHAKVRLFKEADLGESVLGVFLAIGSLGTVCLLPEAPSICRQARTATTDANGNYSFEIKGSDTQGLIGNEDTLDLVVGTPGGDDTSPSTTLTFTAKQTSISLPDARLWNKKPDVGGGHNIDVNWSGLGAAYGTGAHYSAQLFTTRQQALWSQPANGTSARIDSRILEGLQATVAVSARTDLSGTGAGSVHGNYLSPRLEVAGSSDFPPSRHANCSAVTGTFKLALVPQSSCGVTDGDLVDPAKLTTSKQSGSVCTGVVVDLGSARPIHLIVGRGLSGMVDIEVSTDGVTYRQVGIGTDTTFAVTPGGTPTARYVRVHAPSGLDESLMSELSIW